MPAKNNLLKGAGLFLLVGLVFWLVFIAPFASTIALLGGQTFYSFLDTSLLFLPLPFLLFLTVFRTKFSTFRWWVFQYLGVCGICISGALTGIVSSAFLPSVYAGIVSVVSSLIFCAWAIYSAHRIHVVNLPIKSDKLNKTVRLVQISDVHIGSRRPSYLQKVIDLVEAQRPDVLVITGDLVDENIEPHDLNALAGREYPVFYSSGNHERYVNYREVVEFIADQGIIILSDGMVVTCGLTILGIGDRESVGNAEQALNNLVASDLTVESHFSVLLYHQPDLWPAAQRHGIDLTLSGHTHNGQVWPFGLLVRTRYRHVAGLFQQAGRHLFVSQGTGTWGPIMRFGTRCEITVIDLIPD